jgi:hypothetical protein
METRVFIDLCKDDKRIKIMQIEKEVEYRFVNILAYAKEKYELTIDRLRSAFQVSRQTMYNYLSMSSMELPKKTKNIICEIYGLLTIEEVVENEMLVEYETSIVLPILNELLNSDGFSYSEGFDEYFNDQTKVFQQKSIYGGRFYYPEVKEVYNYAKMWKKFLQTYNPIILSESRNNIEIVHNHEQQEDKLSKLFETMKGKHSSEYLYLLFKIIENKISIDDDAFFLYVSSF